MHANVLTGTPMDDEVMLDLQDLMRACAQPQAWIVELVEVGILEPAAPGAARGPEQWRFSAQSLFTARTVWRLQRDLGVNLEGAALALELMNQLDELRARLLRAGLET